MLFKKVFTLSAAYIVNTVISGIFGIYITRILGPEEKGILTIALSSCDVLSMFLSIGIPYSAAYYIRSHPGSKSFILSQTNRMMVIGALLSFSLVLLGKNTFSAVFLGGRQLDSVLVLSLVAMIIVNMGNTIVGATLVAQGDSRGYAISINAGTILNVISTLVLLSFFQQKLHAIILGMLIGTISATLMMRNRYYRYDRVGTGASHVLPARNFYIYGVQAQAGALASLVFKRIDIFIISYFINTSAVGLYSVGLGLRDLAMTASRAFAGLAGGEMADPVNQVNGTARKIFNKGIIYNIVISSILFLGALLVFPYFIPLAYGEAFSSGIKTSIIIMGSLLPLSISLLIGKAIQSKGKPLLQSINNVIGAVICTVVVWQFTKYYGILGAASATIIDSIVVLMLSSMFLFFSNGNRIMIKRLHSS